MSGNAPCPRSEVAYVYVGSSFYWNKTSIYHFLAKNPILDKAIIWGGYNPDLPTDSLPLNQKFAFSYYADTFIYNASSLTDRKWRQVMTRGFPTYRAQAQLIADPESGRIFLFGGFTNNDYVPSRHNVISRAFGDVWELRIDLPGGHFEGVDLALEGRTAQLGPWQRCFTCGSAGPWRKCGGRNKDSVIV